MGTDDLRAAYMEAMLEDPAAGLEGFLARVAAGEFGPQPREALLEFVRGVERDIMAGIQTRAGAMRGGAEGLEQVVEERRAEIRRLVQRYVPDAPAAGSGTGGE